MKQLIPFPKWFIVIAYVRLGDLKLHIGVRDLGDV